MKRATGIPLVGLLILLRAFFLPSSAQTLSDSLDVYYKVYEEAEKSWFKEGKRYGVAFNLPYGLFSFYNLLGGGNIGNKILPPPVSITGIYHPKNSYSFDFTFHYERNRSSRGARGSQTGERYHVGLRSLYFFESRSRTRAYAGGRVGYLFNSDMDRVLEGYELNRGLFTRTNGVTVQLCLGMEQRILRDGAVRFELALGNPYFFSVSFCHYVF